MKDGRERAEWLVEDFGWSMTTTTKRKHRGRKGGERVDDRGRKMTFVDDRGRKGRRQSTVWRGGQRGPRGRREF